MEGGLAEPGSGGLSGVSVLEAVGLARQQSVPLVKIVTSTARHPLSDVITRHPLNDVITGPLRDVIARPLRDVTLHADDVTLSHDDAKESCTTTSTRHVTPSTTTSSLGESKATTTFHIEPDWREAAREPVLIVRCKKTIAELVKSKFGSGSRGKCIRLGKLWYTPTEFEAHCGRSASKDWKRSIRFQGQSLLTLIEDGFLQVHATSCSCGACLDDDAAAGSVRLHRPYKRKRRDRFFLDTEKALKHSVSEDHGSATPTVTVPVSGLGELTVVPGIVLGSGTPSSAGSLTTTPQATSSIANPANSPSPGTLANLPLDKAWEHMNEVLVGLERSVSGARVLLEELRERTQQETFDLRQKLLEEKDEAVTQAKFEAQLSNMAKSSEGFLVQVREDDGSQSLQPIMLDSLISNVPSLNPAPPINGVRKKCVNCNRESELECSSCHNRAYCSDFCQRRDWANHQNECGRSSPTSEDTLNTVTQAPGYIFMLSD
ncbi:deformed epidermal autoregulatory factor 1 [Procambarus clarkii]|uniref:deformed epidermal autoregulatory factor 1 n=1 Tax=Procambarus clarkii TaxID=6728 RepID=UPI001E6720A5|nr:deformed epidermal autoregulatory factor 1 homolog [Procambarus clarkii]